MPGERRQQFANLRALYGWMWAHPGRQLLFMGGELAQNDEWGSERSLDWHLLAYPEHQGVQHLVRTLNRRYRDEPALWERDFDWTGFRWLDADDADHSILSFLRMSADGSRLLACVANLTPVVRHGYRVGLPHGGPWVEILNTDLREFGGSGLHHNPDVDADETPWLQMTHSAVLTLPPLAVLWLVPRPDGMSGNGMSGNVAAGSLRTQ